jgi:hypothetical protein
MELLGRPVLRFPPLGNAEGSLVFASERDLGLCKTDVQSRDSRAV